MAKFVQILDITDSEDNEEDVGNKVESITTVPNTVTNAVLNNDILLEIFSNFSVKQLIKMSRVCRQLSQICNYWLQRQQVLRIGFEDNEKLIEKHLIFGESVNSKNAIMSDISEAIVKNKCFQYFDLTDSGSQLYVSHVLDQCSNIECLYLRQCLVDCQLFSQLMSNCKRLKKVSLSLVSGLLDNESTGLALVDFLRRQSISELSVDSYLDNDLRISCGFDYLSQTSIKSLLINGCIDLRHFFCYLPKSIRCLHLFKDNFDFENNVIEYSRQIFSSKSVQSLVSGNALYLERLKIESFLIDCKTFEVIIDNLFNLIELSVKFCNSEAIPLRLFCKLGDNQNKLEYLRLENCLLRNNYQIADPIVVETTVHSLDLSDCLISPNSLNIFVKIFAKLQSLSFNRFVLCECNPKRRDCEECYAKCVFHLTQLTNITSIRINPCKVRPILLDTFIDFYPNLRTIEIIDIYFDSFDKSFNIYEYLIEVCIKICETNEKRTIDLKIRNMKTTAINKSLKVHKNLSINDM